MGLPTINIVFKKQASDAILRSKKGVVALILKDSTAGNHILTAESQIRQPCPRRTEPQCRGLFSDMSASPGR